MKGKSVSYYASINAAGLANNQVTRDLVAKRHGIQFPKVNPYKAKIEQVKAQLAIDGLSVEKTTQLTKKLNTFTRKAQVWENGFEKKITALTARLDELVTSEVLKAGRLFQAGKLKTVPQAQPPKVNIGVVRPQYKKTDKKKLQPGTPKPGTTGVSVPKGVMLGSIIP